MQMYSGQKRMQRGWPASSMYRHTTRLIKRQANNALFARYGNKYGAALKVGKFIYNNRRSLPFNKVKALLQRRTAPSEKKSSKVQSEGAQLGILAPLQLHTLYISDFPWPARGADGAQQRDHNIIHVKGLKVCRQFEYYAASGATGQNGDIGPITVHWCLLQLKNDEDNTELTAELSRRFFRDNSNDDRTRAFNVNANVWDYGKNCLPLNPNDKVRILTHKRKTLISQGGGQNNTSRGSFWKIQRYYKIKKRFSFLNGATNLPNKRIFECYWYEAVSPTKYPPVPDTYDRLQGYRLNQVYFRDT